MTDPANSPANRWQDLRPRMLSAAVMICVATIGIWAGGVVFTAMVLVLAAIMLWELANITGLKTTYGPFGLSPVQLPLLLAALGAVCLAVALVSPCAVVIGLLLVPSLAFLLTPRKDGVLAAAWAAGVMITGFGLISLRQDGGTAVIVWLVLVVVISDVMGYFAGRSLGGPKFWPAISPKKTWSGTAAGWLGAAGIGLAFWATGNAPAGIILLSAVVSFAGQMGDIAESWIKRRTGVKDSSNLIPGHGGFLDRFDAMSGAVVLVMLLSLIVALPLPTGG
ncbi:phosphatidate cytidylyltransferase [Pseudorhodobacter wandonensis]|uniref:phosphatidate cytidylyltransferase n=1 Tax=Pseudorhodobacter wandonensis TaxID=1120568 RepID=UPI00067E044B|nr:phosphatidate cytidylyltransferase [Pseudorhodobacter wandonensis]